MPESVMQKVERFRDGIESAKTDKTRLATQLEAVDTKLKDNFKVTTLATGEEVMAKEVSTESRLTKEISTGQAKLEERYDW